MEAIRSIGGAVLLAAASAGSAWAEGAPRVQFDMPYAIACRDVTSGDFSSANPHQKLVEARFPISSLVAGEAEDVQSHLYRVESLQGALQVYDYLPKTRLESELAGNVNVVQSKEHSASVGINATGHYEPITAGASAGTGEKEVRGMKYELLPPLEAVVASGTVQRGRGVYFKLRGNRRNWLEGEREFAVILAVPRDWRADYVRVHCEAEGLRRSLVRSLDEKVSAGRRDFLIALHLEGDDEARRVALELAAAEARLRSMAAKHKHAVEKRSYPTLAHRFTAAMAWSGPAIAEDWLPRLIFAGDEIPPRLPPAVRSAAEEFLGAREQTQLLRGVATSWLSTAAGRPAGNGAR